MLRMASPKGETRSENLSLSRVPLKEEFMMDIALSNFILKSRFVSSNVPVPSRSKA